MIFYPTSVGWNYYELNTIVKKGDFNFFRRQRLYQLKSKPMLCLRTSAGRHDWTALWL